MYLSSVPLTMNKTKQNCKRHFLNTLQFRIANHYLQDLIKNICTNLRRNFRQNRLLIDQGLV